MIGIFLAILVFGALLTFKAFYLQVLKGGHLRELANTQFHAEIFFMPERGNIYSSNGSLLATSINVPGIAVDPMMITDKYKTAAKLSGILHINFKKVVTILNRNLQFTWIKKRVSENSVKKIKGLNIEGIRIVEQPVRYYPNKTLLAHVLGFVGINDNGLSGIEYKYNRYLKGSRRALNILHDGLGQDIFIKGFGLTKETHGDNIYLTINKQLQYVTQYYLDKEAKAAHSRGAFAILMDPNTGAILAMADYPPFNPNRYWSYKARYWRNRAVTDDFEPGSAMKPFVVSAALSEGLIKPATKINCHHGLYTLNGVTIHDVVNSFGDFTVNQIVEYSSNIGECQIGMRFKKSELFHWFNLWGFGHIPHGGLPGEADGIIRPLNKWSKIAPCETAFGQGISITGLQEAVGLSALANGGYLMKPYIIKKIVNPYGKMVYRAKPTVIRRIISKKVDNEIKYMMRLVVKGGTGQYSKLVDFRVSGKTGTGQIADPKTGKYYISKYTASFIAFVPYRHPRLAMIVVQQKPKKISYYGGAVSAPVVREVFKRTLNILNISPGKRAYEAQINAVIKPSGNKNGSSGGSGNTGAASAIEDVSYKKMFIDIHKNIMPDLKGDTIYMALDMLAPYDLRIKVKGTGFLYNQSIKPVSKIKKKETVVLRFRPL